MTRPRCPRLWPRFVPASTETGASRMLSDVEDVHPFSGRLSPVAPVFQGRGACGRDRLW